MTPRLITTSLAENIQLAFMCAPPSRCLDMSSRQLVLAINATNAIAIITSDSGSLPNTKASHHLYEYAHSQDQLQYTSKMRGHVPAFSRYVQPHKGQARTPTPRIGKIVQGFSNQAGGPGDQTGSHFPPRTEVH